LHACRDIHSRRDTELAFDFLSEPVSGTKCITAGPAILANGIPEIESRHADG
jgi:hypothetical protein